MRRMWAGLVLLLAAVPADATLIAVDLAAPGDARVTRDTDSGLDWLDVTETMGLSYDDVAGGAGGWFADGWRYATTSEVCAVFAAGGTAPTPCPGSGYMLGDVGQSLLDLLGATVHLTGGDPEISALWGFFDDAGGPLVGEVELTVERYGSGSSDTYAAVTPDRWASTTFASDHGNFLVRASLIPEPTTGLLLALGLGALASRRRARATTWL